jgi:hypothetical protein
MQTTYIANPIPQPTQLIHEDGGRMLSRNVGIGLKEHIVSLWPLSLQSRCVTGPVSLPYTLKL